MTELYRHYDEGGALLYVGTSLSAVHRLSEHKRDAGWFDHIAKVTVERFASHHDALEAETVAIKTERPLWNKTHSNNTRPAISRRRLTARTIENLRLPPDKIDHVVWDDDIPGFGVRLRRGGSRTFIYRYRIGGSTCGVGSSLTCQTAVRRCAVSLSRERLPKAAR